MIPVEADLLRGGIKGRVIDDGLAIILHNRQANSLKLHRAIAERGDIALLLRLPVEGLHYLLQRSGLVQFVAEQAERVFIRRRAAKFVTQEPHPRQPVSNHELHPRVGEIVLRLQDQCLENRHWSKRRAVAFCTIPIATAIN